MATIINILKGQQTIEHAKNIKYKKKKLKTNKKNR